MWLISFDNSKLLKKKFSRIALSIFEQLDCKTKSICFPSYDSQLFICLLNKIIIMSCREGSVLTDSYVGKCCWGLANTSTIIYKISLALALLIEKNRLIVSLWVLMRAQLSFRDRFSPSYCLFSFAFNATIFLLICS